MHDPEAQPPDPNTPPAAPEPFSGAALLRARAEQDKPAPAALRSADGRVTLTGSAVTVRGQTFMLRELERAELTPVQWILWYLLGGLGLAAVMIAFLQNWLRTGPAMLGMAAAALLLAYGRRGTNRLRLHRLGREVVNFALPGDVAGWQRLTAELNRRIFRVHDQAAREAAAALAAADEATRQDALTAQAANPGPGAPPSTAAAE